MRPKLLLLVGLLVWGQIVPVNSADLFERLGFKKRTVAPALAAMTDEQVKDALVQALSQGIQNAVATLGAEGGFLDDPKVRIAIPDKLRKAEKALKTLGQTKTADEFVTSLNRAAEEAVPQVAAVLEDCLKNMTVADARALLTGSNNAATDYFRSTAAKKVYASFLPVVREATTKSGATAAYKRLLEKARLGDLGVLSGLANASGLTSKGEALDIDDYVTRKAMDGLFAKIAEEEQRVREFPASNKSQLVRDVFGALKA